MGAGTRPHGGWTKADMIFYYLLVAVMDIFTAVNEDDWQIAADIREGAISQFLLKPIDYLWYRFCLFLSGRLAFIMMAAVPLAVFIFCFRSYFVLPANETAAIVFPISSFLTALLQFFISYGMAMLAFWLLEISTFIFILFAFEYIASGHMFPLDLLPAAFVHAGVSPAAAQGFYNFMMLTPFPYQLYFPVSVYMGKITGPALWNGLMVQFIWVLLSYSFARFMWRRGVKKYSAFGGG